MIIQVSDSACRDILAIAERLSRQKQTTALGFIDGLEAMLTLTARRLEEADPGDRELVDITHIAYGRYLVFIATGPVAITVLHVSDAGSELEALIGFGD